ncbi:Lpg1974 family pore-forming outer membrane protein [Lacipirellula parvula]|uniref:Uncharacterized protein n=1 Tax=Lacipirellula parvula TaxID=2650471 RepID=A0A5K7XBT8_9BACT|nr:Lpg1974 family pore-forming outer membrane protein [Lacipirellula parvula]BBO33497.1 hypothetical protein PLANPX_3109 [Lacipirellula parvula]
MARFSRWSLGLLLASAAGSAAAAADAPATVEQGFVDPASYGATYQATALAGQLQKPAAECYNRLEFSAALLYLQPIADNLEYGTQVTPLPAPSPHWVNQGVDPGLSPAFNVGLRYIVPENGNDVRLSWTHLNADGNDSFTADAQQFAGPPYEIGPDSNLYNVAQGNVEFEYDSVNLEVGHLLTDNSPAQVRVFGGLQYARISEELTGSFASFDGSYLSTNTNSSLFNGVGPRLGMEAGVVKGRFDLLGQIAGSALVGRQENQLDFAAISPDLPGLGITPPNRQSISSPDATRVVPAIDSKLGAGLTIPMQGGSILRIEAGYQAAVYINAISQYAISDVVVPPNVQGIGVFLESAYHLHNNFAVHGPYASASWAY